MREFKSGSAFADHLDRVAARIPGALQREVKAMGTRMRDDAKAMLGHYQDNWPQLAERTMKERTRFGFTPDDPLLRSGQLRDLIQFEAGANGQGFIGVKDGTITSPNGKSAAATLVAATMEWGSADGRVPARPVYGRLEHRFHTYFEPFADGFMRRIGL